MSNITLFCCTMPITKSLKSQFIVSLVLIALSACSEVNEVDNKTVFRYNEPGGISSLDPANSRNLENIWAVNQLFDGLVALDKQLRVVPKIAKSWQIDSTGKIYHFVLRPDVYFHQSEHFKEGRRRVLASDFVYSFSRLVDPSVASAGSWVLNSVKRHEDGSMAVNAINDSTLRIELNASNPAFLSLLATQYCVVLPKEVVEAEGNAFRSRPIGTGPFKFFMWEEGLKLILHKNEQYFQKDAKGNSLPYLDAVAVSFIKDQSAALMGMQRGDFDFISGLDAASKQNILTPEGNLSDDFKSSCNIIKTPFLKTDYLGIRLGLDSLLDEKKVRRALSIAINREALVKFVLNDIGEPAYSGFVPSSLWKNELKPGSNLMYNPNVAKEILKEFPNIKNHEIVISTTATAIEVCEFVQRQWMDIGLKVRVDILPPSHHRQETAQGNLAMFRKSWIADYPDPENFLGLGYSEHIIPAGPNYFYYKNAAFDRLYLASGKTSGLQRDSLLAAMQELLNKDMPLIPLFYDEVFQLCSKQVSGLQSDGMNVLDLTQVRLLQD